MLVYKLLNKNAKNWWFHVQLREQNKAGQARQLERKSIKSRVETLRKARYFSVGDYGSVLTYDSGWLSGLNNVEDMIVICQTLSIPVLDSRGATYDQKFRLMSMFENDPVEYVRKHRAIMGVDATQLPLF